MPLLGAVRTLFAREAQPRESTPPPSATLRRAAVPREWERLKGFLSACESSRLDLSGLHPSDCVGFFERRAVIEGAVHAGIPLGRVVRDHGFADAWHWETVVRYFEARHSELVFGPEGTAKIRFVDEFRRAEAVVRERLRQADLRSVEPIHGVSLERFAEVSAAIVRLGGSASRPALSRVLAELGVGAAAYGAVRRGWLERIPRDSTRSLQRRYQDAFLAARSRFATLSPPEEQEVGAARARRSWADEGAEVA